MIQATIDLRAIFPTAVIEEIMVSNRDSMMSTTHSYKQETRQVSKKLNDQLKSSILSA